MSEQKYLLVIERETSNKMVIVNDCDLIKIVNSWSLNDAVSPKHSIYKIGCIVRSSEVDEVIEVKERVNYDISGKING